ncbi:DUF222 domain-containing protein [Citricoccus nitrophenolicus]|uniref:DUF222 domain-containing protein n=1 Tax=Citricoccus nitrophenolicus TaxID=863575 RepID=A0ABV0IK58_9MICC|nr:DUF222 domain-containing protein [Citricoccus sp. I39-566]WMY79524.1 DUF222 domain-containing protein [Citricoccus sp. I39-566]
MPGDAVDLVRIRQALAAMRPADDPAEAVDRIRVLEELKAACAAAQARETVVLNEHRQIQDAAHGRAKGDFGRGVCGEVGLARRESPNRGRTRLRLARHLVQDMPHTLAALTTGEISEDRAALLERETHWLPPAARRRVDESLAERMPFLGDRRLISEVRQEAIRQDPVAATDHFDRAPASRHVTVKPAGNGMAYLTALLPLEQAVACRRALMEHAASVTAAGEATGRTTHQIMADAVVERLTGQERATDTTVEIQLVMTDAALLDGEDTPAWLPGHGPVPAEHARQILGRTEAEVYLRRLYTAPETKSLVAMDSQQRTFPALLRRMVLLRDDLCRTPYCDAPIRHADHAVPHRDGGQTSWENASGLCARCNFMKENPGWNHRPGPNGLEVRTPTGHVYAMPVRPFAPPERRWGPGAGQAA